jgi:hypothetical protein
MVVILQYNRTRVKSERKNAGGIKHFSWISLL